MITEILRLNSLVLRAGLVLASVIISPVPGSGVLAAEEALIDAVVASVDGKPITLQDIARKLNPPRGLSLSQIQGDQEARAILEFLIMEKLILNEAEAKKVGVSNSEIEEYINEVAARNNLSREGFEAALAAENRNFEEYKRLLKIDILKSKLTANYVKSGVSVSEQEIDEYIKNNPELSKSGSKVKLRQILVRTENRSEEDAQEILEEVHDKLKDGADFKELAKKYSESPDAEDGGELGMLAEEDLSREIFDAIFQLDPGQFSGITKTPAGFHIFQLEERLVENDEGDAGSLRAEVKKIIYDRKMQDKMAAFFSHEIYKLHTVDRKI